MQSKRLVTFEDINRTTYEKLHRLLWLHVLHHHGDFLWKFGRKTGFTADEFATLRYGKDKILKGFADLMNTHTQVDLMNKLTAESDLYIESLLTRIALKKQDLSEDEIKGVITSSITTYSNYLDRLGENGAIIKAFISLMANQKLDRRVLSAHASIEAVSEQGMFATRPAHNTPSTNPAQGGTDHTPRP